MGSAEVPPLLHPTAKASTAAPPNSAIAVLAPDFIKRSILMSGGRFLHTRVHINCWIAAATLSWYSVTVPLSHHCQPTQCASSGEEECDAHHLIRCIDVNATVVRRKLFVSL